MKIISWIRSNIESDLKQLCIFQRNKMSRTQWNSNLLLMKNIYSIDYFDNIKKIWIQSYWKHPKTYLPISF